MGICSRLWNPTCPSGTCNKIQMLTIALALAIRWFFALTGKEQNTTAIRWNVAPEAWNKQCSSQASFFFFSFLCPSAIPSSSRFSVDLQPPSISFSAKHCTFDIRFFPLAQVIIFYLYLIRFILRVNLLTLLRSWTCARPIGLVFPSHSLFYLLIPFSYIIVACRSPKYWDRVQRCTSCRISYVH